MPVFAIFLVWALVALAALGGIVAVSFAIHSLPPLPAPAPHPYRRRRSVVVSVERRRTGSPSIDLVLP